MLRTRIMNACILCLLALFSGCKPKTVTTKGDTGSYVNRNEEYQKAFAAPVETSDVVVLPNYVPSFGHPMPPYVDFFEWKSYHPDYLLCTYNVNDDPYDPAKEFGWFVQALTQIRTLGRSRFPEVRFIAVIILNFAEAKGESTFVKSHKVGAVFDAASVFNPSQDINSLVSQAKKNRHPFAYDPSKPTPEQQQKWLIVDENEATTRRAAQ
jgi:hypothetical protein